VISTVQKDVTGLELRRVEYSGHHALLPLRLILELCLGLQVGERGDGVEHPRKLGMFGYRGLHEQCGALGVNPRGKQRHHHFMRATPKVVWRVRNGYGVIVHNAEKRFTFVLKRNPIPHCAEVVSNVELPRRLNTTEYPCHPS